MEDKVVKTTGLSERVIQIVSLLFLFLFVIVDKVLHYINPPITDEWYLGLFLVGIFGTEVSNIVDIIKALTGHKKDD